jgi:hypothetical protein
LAAFDSKRNEFPPDLQSRMSGPWSFFMKSNERCSSVGRLSDRAQMSLVRESRAQHKDSRGCFGRGRA